MVRVKYLGFRVLGITDNRMEKKIDNEMETGFVYGLSRYSHQYN